MVFSTQESYGYRHSWNLTQWSTLLNAMGGALKPEKCFWYMLDYTCEDG